jgi:outer membrane immunogenic protein
MIKSSVSRAVIAAFATLVISGLNSALAQSADTRRVDDIERENADLRTRIHRLEAEKENANLRAKLQQLKGQPSPREVATNTPAPQPGAPARQLIDYAGGGTKMGAFAMAPYYSWTGFYIGGNIGYGVGNDRASGGLTSNGITDVTGADTPLVPFGAIGGVQLGYNWQGGSNWLAGFETDFQSSAQKGTTCVFLCITAPAIPQVEDLTVQHTLDYFGTVRGRFGFVNNNTLFYVTGGGAYAHVGQTLQATLSQGNTGTFASTSTGENKFGFVVGAGLEASLGGNWTGKVEYLYMDLGSTNTVLSGQFSNTTPFTLSVSSTLHDNIVRAGLNYRFGAPDAAYNAFAADLPVKASAPERIYSWTGFYAGANVGYGFGNDHDLTTETLALGALSLVVTSDPGSSVTPNGAIGGIQLGYNWQASPHLLAGFEADLQGSAQTDTSCTALACENQTNGANSGANFNTVQQQLDYFGTLRGRLGVINGNILYYATGGAAFGHVTQSVSVNASQVGIFGSASSSADMIGWTVGGGIEAALGSGWTAKAEYLYMDLGSISTTVNVSNPSEQASLATTSTIRDHIVRIGANYHFNSGPDIIAARY